MSKRVVRPRVEVRVVRSHLSQKLHWGVRVAMRFILMMRGKMMRELTTNIRPREYLLYVLSGTTHINGG